MSGVPGDTLYATFTVTNTGNVRDSIDASWQVIPPSTGGLAQAIWFFDVNGNGLLDPGEDDPGLFTVDPANTLPLSIAFVLGSFFGDAYVEVAVQSLLDPSPATLTSVALITTQGSAGNLHLGPVKNAIAAPGGEGSADDVTEAFVGYGDTRIVFLNDIANLDSGGDIVQLAVADTTGWPPGTTVTFRDTTGTPYSAPPGPSPAPGAFGVTIGAFQAGETKTIQVELNTNGLPFSKTVQDSLRLRLSATSLVDTTRSNETTDVVHVPDPDAGAVISLDQTFRENSAAFGDVVTLVVTVSNISDSLGVDSVTVYESVDPTLNFLSSPDFAVENGNYVWRLGALPPGQKREAAIKLVANSRVAQGKSKAVGAVTGVAATTDPVAAGPVVNTLRIINDIFGDEGIVLGAVYYDDNGNGKRDQGEEGVRGTAVFMESGEFAITDSLGLYSIPRVFSGRRIVRLDESSLPPGSEPRDPFYEGGRAVERIVHLLPAGNAVVNFAVHRVKPAPDLTRRSIRGQEFIGVQKRRRVIYQIPAIQSSQFEVGQSYLKSGYDQRLRPILDFMNTQQQWVVVIEGHTDSIPINTPEFPDNQALSVARASAIVNYLTANGLPESRIRVRGYGDTRPIASNATAEGRAANRRVEVGFLPSDAPDTEDPFAFDRVAATVRKLAEAPDTMQVQMMWEFSTDAPQDMRAEIAFDIPPAVRPHVLVRHAGVDSVLQGSTFTTHTFRKSIGIQCEVRFSLPETDTALVALVRPVVKFAWADTAAVPDEVVDVLPFVTSLQPPPHAAIGGTRVLTIHSWDEIDREPRERKAESDKTPDLSLQATPDVNPLEFGIVDPLDGDVYTKTNRIPVTVRVPLGSKVELYANDERVDDAQIGNKAIDLKNQVEVIAFYGVPIGIGWNTIELKASPVNGNFISDSLYVAFAGKATQLIPLQKRVLIPADGRAGASVRFAIKDELQLPVADGVVATVVRGDSILLNADERPDMRGLQLISTDGYFQIDIGSSTYTGKHDIVLESEGLQASVIASYVPAGRPPIVSGVLEGRVGVFNASGEADPLGLEGFEDGTKLGGDARVFVQGKTYAGMNLTARLDSDIRYEDPLLKMTNPERQYPVYGDDSEIYYAAPARSGNYVALEKNESFVRYGDFRTPTMNGEFLRYARSATGVDGKLASGDDGIKGFVTKTDLATFRDEMDADGTSGFYYLNHSPVVENSEQVWIEIRDRFQPEKILEVRPKVQYRDYTINQENGAILFKYPIDRFTPNMNPVKIVVIYEVESSEEGYYLYGARGDLAKTGAGRIGATAVTRGGTEFDYALYGADGEFRLGRMRGSGEFARSEDDLEGEGNAAKLEIGYHDQHNDHALYYRDIDEGFYNPSFTGGAAQLGSKRFGYDGSIAVSDRVKLEANAFRHMFERTDEEKDNLAAIGAYDDGTYSAQAGARVAREDLIRTGENDALLSIVGAGIRSKKRFEFKTHWEHNLRDQVTEDWPDRLKSMLAIPLSQYFRITANHEYLSAHERPATHQFLAGVEGKLGNGFSTFTKYSMNRTANDERMGAVLGVRQKLKLSETVTASVDVEGLRSISDRVDEEYVAFTSGLNWLDPGDATVETQYEYRWQRSTDRHLLRLNGLKQFRNNSALLLQQATTFTTTPGEEDAIRSEGRIGGLYRPVYTPVSWLLLLKNKYDRFSPIDPEAITWRLVFSTDVNWYVARRHELRLKLAVKHMESYSNSISETTDNALVLGQYVWQFARRWDADLWARYLDQGGVGTRQLGAGVELGYIFFDRIRVGAGYAVNGFEERDLSENDAWANGFGIRVQLILSEWILNEMGLNDAQ